VILVQRLGILIVATWVFLGFMEGVFMNASGAKSENQYVGSATCGECHEAEYQNFMKYAKKSKSFESIAIMRKGLTGDEEKKCFECHTTGYGKPGGFRSEGETPDLRNAGCEVCHGPGSDHVISEDAEDIKGRLTVKDCETCHNSERVEVFKYKPLIYGGAH
jgi:nitrate/TMAO reductase-like tetraheme cytochrome c subunit